MTDPPVVIVGAGVAGLSAALEVARHGRGVILIDASDGQGASVLAQGGLAAAVGQDDHWLLHCHDTLVAGEHHSNLWRSRRLTRQAPRLAHWLVAQGVAFDRLHDSWALAREAAHSRARILHASGDASGHVLVQALRQKAFKQSLIDYRPHHRLTGLGLHPTGVCAAVVCDDSGRSRQLPCATLILASGGAAGLFAKSTQPADNTGGPMALALAAGARLHDASVFQFHPTAFDRATPDGRHRLISEALRGAGAQLVDHRGKRLRDEHGRHLELQPRNRVAVAIERSRRQGPVYLDPGPLGGDLERRFPSFIAHCHALGLDPQSPVPVCPVAHYHVGGLAVDRLGRSQLPGLMACGEVAATGLHGSNRLASNSLPEAVHGGLMAGRYAARHPATERRPPQRVIELSTRPVEPHLRRQVSRFLGMQRQQQALLLWQEKLLEQPSSPMQMLLLAMVRDALCLPSRYGCHQRDGDRPLAHLPTAAGAAPCFDS